MNRITTSIDVHTADQRCNIECRTLTTPSGRDFVVLGVGPVSIYPDRDQLSRIRDAISGFCDPPPPDGAGGVPQISGIEPKSDADRAIVWAAHHFTPPELEEMEEHFPDALAADGVDLVDADGLLPVAGGCVPSPEDWADYREWTQWVDRIDESR